MDVDVEELATDSEGLAMENDGPQCPSSRRRLGGSSWRPGENCGPWVGPVAPLTQQAQVIITNTFFNVKRFSRKVLKTIAQGLCCRRGKDSSRQSIASQIVAFLAGVSRSAVAKCVEQLRANNWQPVSRKACFEGRRKSHPEVLEEGCQETAASNEDKNWTIMSKLVRIALANASEGRSGLAFEREVRKSY